MVTKPQIDYVAKYGTVFTALLVLAGTIYQATINGKGSDVEYVKALHHRIDALEIQVDKCLAQRDTDRVSYFSCLSTCPKPEGTHE